MLSAVFLALGVASADKISSGTKLGKLRGANLPVEYELARFIEDASKKDSSWSTSVPACKWKGVVCVEGIVSTMDWGDRKMEGELNWDYIPSSLTYLRLAFNELSGDIPFNGIPRQMTVLNVTANRFSGPLLLKDLPDTMKNLFLSYNRFSGIVDPSEFPKSLWLLYVSDNKDLCGRFSRGKLPINFDLVKDGTQIIVDV